MNALQGSIEKAATLIEALPYIQNFRGKVVVVKYGGSTMVGDQEEDTVLKDIVFMASVGICPVIVHGGGPAINRRLEERGVETERINGLRVTDKATMGVVEDVLFGEVNAGIVRDIEAVGGKAVGISGKDAEVLNVRKYWANTADGPVDIGFVGDVERVSTEPITDLIENGMIPVVAPIGRGEDGQSYNVNADTAAGEIAAALRAEKLVFLTDVTGIMRDPEEPSTLISTLPVLDVDHLVEEAVISGGMMPKVEACVKAVKSGVRKTHVVDGRIPHSMLLEIFTREGIGTEIVQ
ncbi:MAG: acetylglutamate kinase [Candidatus Latescibacterota bacterium]|nr:acetylglutamate kinase [Candidatus Latescibacterota bacterium]MEC8645758.1 acetylglutamate kinase [Candidatus Latescibacterota bacterium]MEE2727663.1 acetylglutamate kinase [Candidatus Latescibacterota bacterium]